MAKSESKNGANIGSASLILIFIVLCLGTFGLLSLSSAKNDLDLAERNGRSVSGFYRADAEERLFWRRCRRPLMMDLQKIRKILNPIFRKYWEVRGFLTSSVQLWILPWKKGRHFRFACIYPGKTGRENFPFFSGRCIIR